MASSPILNPDIPYVGEVEGGLVPGRMVKVRGKIPPTAIRFAINYQLGPNLNPRDDIAIHVSPRFPEGFITRNHIESMVWGPEENEGPLWFQQGQDFEVIILCDHTCYKIAINGRHFTEFTHRLPYQKVTHLVIDGDVEVTSISYEGGSVGAPRSPRAAPIPDVPTANFGPPPPGGLYPSIGPQIPQGGYGPPPGIYGGPGGYNPPRAYDYHPGYEKPEEEDVFGGCLDKVGLALGGLVAAGGVAAAVHAINKRKEQEKDDEKIDSSKTESGNEGGLGGLGVLGAALASSLAANAVQGNNRPQPQPGYPSQDSGVLGSILGALGGGGGPQQQPSYPAQQPTSTDPLSGALGSILGGVLGGGGNNPPAYQPSGGYGGYQPSGGYGSQQQGTDNSNLLSNIGTAIGSSLLSSAFDGFGKHGKDKSERDNNPASAPSANYGSQSDPVPPRFTSRSASPPAPGGGKLSAADISRGLGLGDDEDD